MSQNSFVLLLNVLPDPGIELCVSFENSQDKNSFNRIEVLSLECARLIPHPLQRHLCLPEEVNPFFFIGVPQTGHDLLFIARSLFLAKKY